MSDAETDVVVVGGGPAGLSAALALGRAVKKVWLCDGGPRRNAAAEEVHGFVTRDGIPPSEFRWIAREQLRPYAVVVKDVGVRRLAPLAAGRFEVTLEDSSRVTCRRVLLATGLVDDVPDLPGIREHWGRSVFACPYCHGWELRERGWGILATDEKLIEFAIFLTGWTRDVIAFTNGPLSIPEELRGRLRRAGVSVEERRLRRLVPGPDGRLSGIEVEGVATVPREAMVVRPAQRQVPLVRELGLAVGEDGFVQVDDDGETSIPGIYAAGDLNTQMQSALFAAAAGARVAYRLNQKLNFERA